MTNITHPPFSNIVVNSNNEKSDASKKPILSVNSTSKNARLASATEHNDRRQSDDMQEVESGGHRAAAGAAADDKHADLDVDMNPWVLNTYPVAERNAASYSQKLPTRGRPNL